MIVISMIFIFFGLPLVWILGFWAAVKDSKEDKTQENHNQSHKMTEEEYENYYGITSYSENHDKYFGRDKYK